MLCAYNSMEGRRLINICGKKSYKRVGKKFSLAYLKKKKIEIQENSYVSYLNLGSAHIYYAF